MASMSHDKEQMIVIFQLGYFWRIPVNGGPFLLIAKVHEPTHIEVGTSVKMHSLRLRAPKLLILKILSSLVEAILMHRFSIVAASLMVATF